MDVSITEDGITFSQPGSLVIVPYVDTNNADSIMAVRNSVSQIVLKSDENIRVDAFYNPSTNYYITQVTSTDASVREIIASLLTQLKEKAATMIDNVVNANALNTEVFNHLLATVTLVTSILGKVYISLTVNEVASDMKLKSEDDIDSETAKIKGLLKDTFSLVLKLDSVGGI